jgi:hypothetical protein
MKRRIGSWVLLLVVSFGVAPRASFAQGLGATKLDGLKDFSECLNQVAGHHENLIADRLEAKLKISTALTQQERDIWAGDIRALRQVTPSQPNYKSPDPKDPQHYFLGMTNDEQVAINSMNSRFSQEVNLACEKKYGGMTRYSGGGDQSSQTRYEQGLRDQMQTPIDIATIPVAPLPSPFPKTREQIQEERRAAQQASRQAIATKMSGCMDAAKGLRLSIVADKMQKRLDSSQGLSAKDRADFEADIKATRDAAGKGLDMAAPVDPSNPNRAVMRLTTQDQLDITKEFMNQYMARMQSCTKR